MAATDDFVTLLDAVTATGAGDTLEMDGPLGGPAVFELAGTFSATVTFQGSLNGSDWYSVQAERLEDGSFSTTATNTGLYRIEGSAVNAVRPNVTAYTSGNVTVRAASQHG